MSTNHSQSKQIAFPASASGGSEPELAPGPGAATDGAARGDWGAGGVAKGSDGMPGAESRHEIRREQSALRTAPAVPTGERVLHWMMFGLGLGVFSMSLVMKTEGQSQVYLPGMQAPMPELCSSRMLFGVDCPGCGMTRAFISISHGQLRRAWHFNPASFFVYLLIVGQVPWQAFQLWRIRRGMLPMQSNWIYLIPAVTIVLILAQWLIRMFVPL